MHESYESYGLAKSLTLYSNQRSRGLDNRPQNSSDSAAGADVPVPGRTARPKTDSGARRLSHWRLVLVDGSGQVCQERAESGEIDGIGLRPDDPMRENLLAIVLVDIETIAIVKRLAVDHRVLDRGIETILDLRRSQTSCEWRRHRVQVLDDMDKWLSPGRHDLGDVPYRVPDAPSTGIVVIHDDNWICEPWSGEPLGFFVVRCDECAQHATATVLEVQKSRRARTRILVESHLQANLSAQLYLRQSRELRCQASDRVSEVDVVGLPLADDHGCLSRVERAVDQELAVDLLSR